MKTNITKVFATIFMALVLAWIAVGCKKHGAEKPPALVVIWDSSVVIHDKAWLVAEVTDDGGGEITERGFCYGIDGGPADTLICSGDARRFSAELVGLMQSKPYVCRAFAVNEAGVGYSEEYRFTTLNDTIPLVNTLGVNDITAYLAVVSGKVVHSGNQTVLERGVCYGTEWMPTVADAKVASGTGVGAYECELTLTPETFYYVRAYAECSEGVYYGDQLTFAAQPDIPPLAVRTMGVSDVTGRRVLGRGEVVEDGGCEVLEYGFCWGLEHQPTVEGLHVKVGIGMGEFSRYFSGLERGRTHYMRAYAINEEGVAYGEEVEFVPDDPLGPWPEGALPGLFSVSPDRQVRFSQGNLQYYPDDNKWRFAESQWDFVGGTCWDYYLGYMNVGTVYANEKQCDNTKTHKYYTGWVDLFGWGTSGWNSGNNYYHPYDYAAHVYECTLYGPPGNFNLTGNYAQADWGVHNFINNGGSRQWRTPTADEFLYLLTERVTPSGIRFALAIVAGVRGMIVLPDDWEASTYDFNAVNEHWDYSPNQITGFEWLNVLEPAGAVFMPAGGQRIQFTTYDGVWYDCSGTWMPPDATYDWHLYHLLSSLDIGGSYWTVSQSGMSIANAFQVVHGYESNGLLGGCINPEAFRCHGCSVRLVSDE